MEHCKRWVGGGAELIFPFSSGLYSQRICYNLTALGVYNTQSKVTGDSFFLSFISWVAKTQFNHSLAQGYIPAEKHCKLFCQLVGDVLGYANRYAPIPQSGTVSWVICD